jgi:parallel beta-helix repeat protein
VHLRNCGINNYAAGIFVKDPVDYQITGNIIGNNYWGIVVSPTQPVSGTHTHLTTISENHITTSHNGFVYAGWGTGIYVKEDQDNGWILSNVIYSGKNGVVVKDTDWTRIGSNRIYGTFTPGYGGDGIFSSNTDNLDISTNDVEGYATNVQLGAGSTGSRFYSNNFAFSQGINAIDLGMNNEWYNTYYTMGNYWSDHVCVDNVQPIGICDNPKTIYTQGGALVQDLYPRKTPI